VWSKPCDHSFGWEAPSHVFSEHLQRSKVRPISQMPCPALKVPSPLGWLAEALVESLQPGLHFVGLHIASHVGRSVFVPVGVGPSPGPLNRECPRWISATGRRCRSPSSTCPQPDGERLSVGATGLRYAYAAVPSHQRRVRSVETACSPRRAALA